MPKTIVVKEEGKWLRVIDRGFGGVDEPKGPPPSAPMTEFANDIPF